MAFVWKPSVYKSSTLTLLPRPVDKLDMSCRWLMDEQKVPLLDGVETYGHSEDGLVFSIQGVIAIDSGTPTITEESMWGVLANLKTVLDVSNGTGKYEFFIYHDTGSATYRKFKECVTLQFDVSIGDQDRTEWPYSIVIRAEDPVIHTTAPGA